jgi:SAM-dependent methyltransferase
MNVDELLAEQIRYYRARAGEYDDWWHRRAGYDLGDDFRTRWGADVEELRASLAAFGPMGDVLELAAGTGNWTSELCRYADRVTAVDAAAEALAINRAKNGDRKVTYVEADVFSWSPPRRFDRACFAFWISHVPASRWERFWTVVEEALTPGGRVWFSDSAEARHAEAHGPAAVRGRGDALDEAGELRERTLRDGRTFSMVKRSWSPRQLEADLAAVGWEASVGTTRWAFIHGTATRASEAVP